jgi:hypothetical protein
VVRLCELSAAGMLCCLLVDGLVFVLQRASAHLDDILALRLEIDRAHYAVVLDFVRARLHLLAPF